MLVSCAHMLRKAKEEKYAVGQFNIHNLEWTKVVLECAREMRSPVILGVTEATARHMGGFATICGLVLNMQQYLHVDVPVALHLDRASGDMCLEAIGAGFTSVAFDGSQIPFQENFDICIRLAAIAATHHVSLEGELGVPAMAELKIGGRREYAHPQQCAKLARSGISVLDAAISKIHGRREKWEDIDFELLEKIESAVHPLPLALEADSAESDNMIEKAISYGICKITIDAECQNAFARATRQHIEKGEEERGAGYNIHKLLKPGYDAIKEKIREKMSLFGCAGKEK